jgi:hypothetical protein
VKRSRILSPEESEVIRFQLGLKGRPREVKAGLQRLCAHYDDGYRLADPHEYRLLIRALIWDEHSIVRRWAYKGLAMIGERHDATMLVQRLRAEDDFENQTWGTTAIVALAREWKVEQICEQTGLQRTDALLLAARLFAPPRWLRDNSQLPVVNIDKADSLTLKWASLLSGYDRAPSNLFDPAHENRILLGKLNNHPVADVSEYSVWALWQHPAYAVNDLGLSLDRIRARPENVRRWINRLLTKDASFLAQNLDLFDELRRDSAVTAREGLALGMRRTFVSGLEHYILDWHDVEPEEIVRILLLEHMAQSADESLDYCDIVEGNYRSAGPTTGMRKRLLAASAGHALHINLRRIEVEERRSKEISLFPEITNTNLAVGSIIMNQSNFTAGRDISAQNIVGGDMIGSANSAIQNMSPSREADQALLQQIMKLLPGATGLTEPEKKSVAHAVTAIAQDKNSSEKSTLIGLLKKMREGAGAVAGTAGQLDGLIHTISGWL